MRICPFTCAIATTFLIADVYVALDIQKSVTKSRFIAVLNESQRLRYNNIVAERRNIYFRSYLIGVGLSIIFLALTKNTKRDGLTSTGIVCTVGAITLLTNYFFYILSPKTDYMVLHLDTTAQKEAWLAIYRHMQVKYHTGLVLGIIASMLFAKATC